LDKFIGDALMAVFGAPLPLTEDHAWMAVQSSLDMRKRLQAFNQRRIIDRQPTIRFGIGISSGEVVSGNIGSKKRMDYTVIGDGVNLSSRLENATKEYGCDIIISESTYQLCGDRLRVRELDRIRVKGKNQAVDIYELIGNASEPLDDKTEEFLHLHQCGRKAYLKRDFARALSYFDAAAAIHPSDRTVQLYRDRCAIYLRHPPPDSWDGTYTMLHK
jgi:adenylate cyclase